MILKYKYASSITHVMCLNPVTFDCFIPTPLTFHRDLAMAQKHKQTNEAAAETMQNISHL